MRSDRLHPGDGGLWHPRLFQCRDGLWDAFAQISREQGISIDELLDEAMVAYARARGHVEMQTAKRKPPAPDPRGQTNLDETMDRPERPPGAPRAAGPSPQRPPLGVGGRGGTAQPFRPMNQPSPPAQMPAPPGRSAARQVGGVVSQTRTLPPPLPSGDAMPPQTQRLGAPGALVLTYQGRPYTVDKDRYLLGRSKSQADLRLDDPNVSRQHAMIERVGNAWYVVDLGSTNGVYVDGERVARRAVRDGDVIEITTHRIECRLR
jgi:hypothetical protein